MVVLESTQIDYCQIICSNAPQSVVRTGASFKNKLFARAGVFTKSQNDDAVRVARQIYVDTDGQKLLLVVHGESEITVWYEEPAAAMADAQVVAASKAERARAEREQLVAQMRGASGIDVRDRRYNLRLYPQCFIGSEMVQWCRRHLNISRPDAVALCQQLLDDGFIAHVVDRVKFEDAYLFYRFCDGAKTS
jgi:hypothetical protein